MSTRYELYNGLNYWCLILPVKLEPRWLLTDVVAGRTTLPHLASLTLVDLQEAQSYSCVFSCIRTPLPAMRMACGQPAVHGRRSDEREPGFGAQKPNVTNPFRS